MSLNFQNSAGDSRFSQRFFYLYALCYGLCWTLAPLIFRHTLPMDALEGYVWGQHLSFGYDRNPWLNAWLSRAAIELGGYSGWLLYAMSQCCVFLAFWSVYRLTSRLLQPRHAIFCVLALSCTQYYNLAAIDFNDNVLELGLWAFSGFYFFQALERNRLKDWTLLALGLGLGLMAKYYTLFLIAAMFLIALQHKDYRSAFKNPRLYFAAALVGLICSPHLVWLSQHQEITFEYALNRTINPAHSFWTQHFSYAFSFLLSTLLNFLPVLVIFLLCVERKKSALPEPGVSIKHRQFLLGLCLYPLALTLLGASIFSWRLHSLWATPLITFWPLLLLFVSKKTQALNTRAIKRVVGITLVVQFLLLTGYSLKQKHHPHQSTIHIIENTATAQALCSSFESSFHSPVRYVVGDRYSAGILAYSCTEHPSVFIEASTAKSPWIDLSELHKHGAIFIQAVLSVADQQFSNDLLMKYPLIQLQFLHADKNSFLIGFLPPLKNKFGE